MHLQVHKLQTQLDYFTDQNNFRVSLQLAYAQNMAPQNDFQMSYLLCILDHRDMCTYACADNKLC